MNNVKHIRKNIFSVSQVEFAEIIGVRQATVSRQESNLLSLTIDQMERIRSEAVRRKIPWSDDWFFDVPQLMSGPQ